MSKTKQLDGGRLWIHRPGGRVPGWESEDGDFDILEGEGYVVLVAFEHDPLPGDTSVFWRKRFATAKQAMEQAEKM